MKKCVTLVVIASLVTGCATPAGMVTKREVSSSELQTYAAMTCEEVKAKYSDAFRLEAKLAGEMNKRAGAQLAANVIGVAALAVGGIGFFYTARNEGSYRDALRNARAELEALQVTAKAKTCDLPSAEALGSDPAPDKRTQAEANTEPPATATGEPEPKKE